MSGHDDPERLVTIDQNRWSRWARIPNRLSKTARLLYDQERQHAIELMDVTLEWANEERLVLTGFEAYKESGQVIDYAQSWLCLVGLGRRLKTEQELYEEQRFRTAQGHGMVLANRK